MQEVQMQTLSLVFILPTVPKSIIHLFTMPLYTMLLPIMPQHHMLRLSTMLLFTRNLPAPISMSMGLLTNILEHSLMKSSLRMKREL